MMADFFKRLKLANWWPWIALALVLTVALLGGMAGDVWMLVLVFVFLSSMFAGVAFGGRIARILNRHVFRFGLSFESRLVQSLQVFGFLSFPTVVGWFANTFLDARVEMYSLGQHMFWNCILSAGAFLIKPDEPDIRTDK